MVRKPREDDDVSLFPFLSVLACVIGTLTLMISALALGEMGEDKDDLLKQEEHETDKKELESLLAELKQLTKKLDEEETKQLSENSEQQQQLASLRDKIKQLEDQIDQARKAADAANIAIVIPTMDAGQQETLDDLTDQLTRFKEQIAQLEKEIEERKLPPKESEVTILPSGSGVGFKPIFVECAETSIVIHAAPAPQRIRAADIASNKTFIDLLTEIVNSPDKTMVFLIRDDALGTWRTAQGLATKVGARNGKLPIIGKGRIDLDYFYKNEEAPADNS